MFLNTVKKNFATCLRWNRESAVSFSIFYISFCFLFFTPFIGCVWRGACALNVMVFGVSGPFCPTLQGSPGAVCGRCAILKIALRAGVNGGSGGVLQGASGKAVGLSQAGCCVAVETRRLCLYIDRTRQSLLPLVGARVVAQLCDAAARQLPFYRLFGMVKSTFAAPAWRPSAQHVSAPR